ncbi:hypothetical protein BDZ85DRAFT_30578 [Elsinoe ampelina]|uniref:Uncharacterized protein n=1 Tax=Elsinoe ampelina TaxID=302913 RepID=A0A6A6G5C6_9PEZI|nr:hypothetical protein BDZ85DRAFT_30578 [Elsinoe ampelina]
MQIFQLAAFLSLGLHAWSQPTGLQTVTVKRSDLQKRAVQRCGQLTCQQVALYEPDSAVDIELIPAQAHTNQRRYVHIAYGDNLPGGDPRITLRNDYDFGLSLTINNVGQGQSNDYRITWVNGASRSLALNNFHAWEDGDDVQYILKFVVPH